jgi:DNA-binding response OmpR family regulator
MKKLLIVDDDVGLTKVYARIGAELGFEVQVVNDSRHATDAFLTFHPDLAVLDLMMPEKDGIDVLNEILLAGTSARVIVTSGFGEGMLRLAEGVATFHANERVTTLKKPVRRAAFAQALTDAVG